MQGGGGAHAGHGHDDDDDDEDRPQDFFAGGEKSGLAVQNPNAGPSARDQVNSILDRARRNMPRPGGDEDDEDDAPSARPSNFRGTARTLGSDDVPSTTIPDPSAPQSAAAAGPRAGARRPRERRVLHIWSDGFSVDSGDLYRFDDPANAATLDMINSGRAPLGLLGVQHGQEVDLEVQPHTGEPYVRPKSVYRPFGGSGQRVGSPTPGPGGVGGAATTTSSVTSAPAAAAQSTTSSSSGTAPQSVQLDESAPTLTLQIRLADGTQMRSRFNTTHTVGDVYAFVDAARPAAGGRQYALMTTFPSKELGDKAVVLGESKELGRGGVVVQKWT
ncbi:hypothetical protein LTS18_001490 [Coniosporium uncinatum]|uniref:Uncharacterized protein n=1 Tax=Coniosporium uncinatum TaxID=93489 RepID=A0ACC3DES4_9PEZI|nr:hypothetical protein LTS18_001490 [Coniosporium uncinatum]